MQSYRTIEVLGNSDLFSNYYNQLGESRIVDTIKPELKYGKIRAGYFINEDNTDGFGDKFHPLVVGQELLYAYREDGNFYSKDIPSPSSTRETEGGIMATYVMTQSWDVENYPSIDDWGGDLYYNALKAIPDYSKVNSIEYLKEFR